MPEIGKNEEEVSASIYSETLRMIGEDADFEQLCRRLFVFSPFEALGVADYEIRHGNFLAHLFNPDAPHGFGEAVLVAFLKLLFASQDLSAKLAHIIINGAGAVQVRREWHDIDIIVELNDPKLNLVIVIELKLHSGESERQLKKYTDLIGGRPEYRNHKKLYVFMTPEGTASTHEGWRDFNMTAGFVDSLRQVADAGNGDRTARAMLADYVRLMEQKFMTEEELDDLAKALWSKYPDALGFLADNRPDLVGQVFDHICDADSETLYARLEELGFDFSKDWDHETNSRLIYSFPNWDDVPGMLSCTEKRLEKSKRLIWLEIQKSSRGIRGIFVIGPGDREARRGVLQALIDGGADTGSQKDVNAMSENWSTLGSKWLYQSNPDQERDVPIEKAGERALEALEKFLVDQLSKMDKAFKALTP